MDTQRLVIAVTSVLASAAYAQGATEPVPQLNADGTQPGFFRPERDGVVVPPFTPAVPGVTPLDTQPPAPATPPPATPPIVGSAKADAELRDSLAAAIAADPQMKGARINVLVRPGVVTLSGIALDQAQADRARAIVQGLAGSAQVTASITTAG